MRSLAIIGAVLIVLGVGGLVFGQFSYSENKPVLDGGPIHVATEKQHHITVPTIASIAALVAGLGLIVVSRRSA